jgi:SET domain-containing protein
MNTFEEILEVHSKKGYRSMFSKVAFNKGDLMGPLPCTAVHSKPTQFTIQAGRYKHIEVGIIAAMNHSCNPNIVMDTTRMQIIAALDIAVGDELTFFYPSTEWEMTVPFICNCDSPNCIHVVAGARYLSPAVLERYFLNQHIRRMINGLLTRAATRYRAVIHASV